MLITMRVRLGYEREYEYIEQRINAHSVKEALALFADGRYKEATEEIGYARPMCKIAEHMDEETTILYSGRFELNGIYIYYVFTEKGMTPDVCIGVPHIGAAIDDVLKRKY